MKFRLVAAVLMLGMTSPAFAAAMSVQTFMTKADSLKKKGPLALLSGDLKRLMNQVKEDSASLRADNQALVKAGKPKAYCTPEGFRMDEDDIMNAMKAVPAQRRATTSTKAALRDYIARRHPCPA